MPPVSAAERSARVAAVFDSVAADYDNVGVSWFQPIARRLVEQVAPRPGERALDIGCGRGAALFSLAEAVGSDGRSTGIDLSARMIEATAADVRSRGLANVDLHVMDAATPTLPEGAFDVAVASFVLFFLPAPVAALRAWRRLLAPAGRLGVSTFAESAAGWLDDVFQPFLPPSVFAGPQPGPFDSDEGVEALFTAAGFAAVRTTVFDLDVEFRDADQWYAWSMSHGQRATWDRIPAAEHARVRAAAGERLAAARDGDGRIRLRQRIRLTLGDRG